MRYLSGALASFPLGCQINDNGPHNSSCLLCMIQNYTYFFVGLAKNLVYFLVCRRHLAIGLRVPWDEKGWKSLLYREGSGRCYLQATHCSYKVTISSLSCPHHQTNAISGFENPRTWPQVFLSVARTVWPVPESLWFSVRPCDTSQPLRTLLLHTRTLKIVFYLTFKIAKPFFLF